MIDPQWFEPPMSRASFHGPKDVRTIEVRLYIYVFDTKYSFIFIVGQMIELGNAVS